MSHIAGLSFVTGDRMFSMDESGFNFQESVPLKAVTATIPVGRLTDRDFRAYVATLDGNIAVFRGPNLTQPEVFHVTDLPVLWSLYHAAGVVYLGTGDFSTPGTLLALDDQTLTTKWQAFSDGGMIYPVSVAYDGNTPRQVIVSSANPNALLRGLSVSNGGELWSVPDFTFGQKVHDGVVYYGNLTDSTLRARSASDGTLLWSFRNPRDFNFQVPVVAGGVVWATSVGNQVFALRASDGSVIWEVQLDGHPGAPVIHFDDFAGLAVVAVAEQDGASAGFLQGIHANTGARLWTSNVPVSQAGESCTDPIAIPHFGGGDQIQVGTFSGTLMTFNAANGQLEWEKPLTPGEALFAKPHFAFF